MSVQCVCIIGVCGLLGVGVWGGRVWTLGICMCQVCLCMCLVCVRTPGLADRKRLEMNKGGSLGRRELGEGGLKAKCGGQWELSKMRR